MTDPGKRVLILKELKIPVGGRTPADDAVEVFFELSGSESMSTSTALTS